MKKITDSDLEKEISKFRWFHSIELRPGIVTNGRKSLELMRREADTTFGPLKLKGLSVLDVGANSGGFTIEAYRRGAAKVTSLDYVGWNDPTVKVKEAFDIACRETGVKANPVYLDLDQPQLSAAHLGMFDVVIFLGVFYHLVDPIAALRELASITKKVMVLETHIETRLPVEPPQMMFYPGNELANDPSNWWGPNISCVTHLLKKYGFKKVDVSQGSAHNRGVFHAYK